MKFCIESAAKKKSGVYLIKSLVDGSGYVGSARNLFSRFSTHRAEMRQGKAINKRVKAKLTKYGVDSFEFHLLELVCPLELPEREQFYVDAFEGECLNTQFRISPFRRKIAGAIKKNYTLKIDEAVLEATKRQAEKENRSASDLIRIVMKAYIAEKEASLGVANGKVVKVEGAETKEKAKRIARINVKVTPNFKEQAERQADKEDVTLSRFIEDAVKEKIEHLKWLNS